MKTCQHEFSATADVFNLAGERGVDQERVAREREQAEQVRREAEAYQKKMQRLFNEKCPGFAGGEMPVSADCTGEVLIESGCVNAAMDWLKRRYIVKKEIEVAATGELRVTFATKRRPQRGCASRDSRRRFVPVEQFELEIWK